MDRILKEFPTQWGQWPEEVIILLNETTSCDFRSDNNNSRFLKDLQQRNVSMVVPFTRFGMAAGRPQQFMTWGLMD